MEKFLKYTKNILIIVLIGLIIFLLYRGTNRGGEVVNNDEFIHKIDSILNTIVDRDKVIDSLTLVIGFNEMEIRGYIRTVQYLNNQLNINKDLYDEQNKKIQSMSSDSLVLSVREQLSIWAN